ncbi:MAG: alpha/beta fold hydrolase [Sulfurifustaceae bacterium]
MTERLPFLLVPGLNCSARIFAHQVPALWQYGPVMIADHTQGDSMETIARSILASAPPMFALVGYSMGGYLSFEILRQARDRVARLALIDTSARPDTPEQTRFRQQRVSQAQAGQFREVLDRQYPFLVHSSRHGDVALREFMTNMSMDEYGVENFVRHQNAIINRPDSRPDLAAIRCPTLVVVGDSDQVAIPEAAQEMARGIKGSRHVIVPECGHMSVLEKPDAVNAALREWING